MDIGKSFTYVFEDPEWVKKVLIGGLFRILPIVSFVADGYWLTQTKNVYEDRDLPLPEWNDFGGFFMKGLYAFVAQIVYSLPIFLLACCAFVLPGFLPGNNSNAGQTSPLAIPVMICGSCLLLLYVLALLVILPAVTTRYAITEQFGALFQIAPAWKMISANIGGYVMALLVFVVAFLVAGLIGGIACLIGSLFTGFWSSLVGAYLFGNFAKGAPQPAPAVG